MDIISKILETQLLGVIIGSLIPFILTRVGRVKLVFVPDSELASIDDTSTKSLPGSFLIDVFNAKDKPIYINNMYIRTDEFRARVFRVVSSSKEGQNIGFERDPITIAAGSATRLFLFAEPPSAKGQLYIEVNHRKRLIKNFRR